MGKELSDGHESMTYLAKPMKTTENLRVCVMSHVHVTFVCMCKCVRERTMKDNERKRKEKFYT